MFNVSARREMHTYSGPIGQRCRVLREGGLMSLDSTGEGRKQRKQTPCFSLWVYSSSLLPELVDGSPRLDMQRGLAQSSHADPRNRCPQWRIKALAATCSIVLNGPLYRRYHNLWCGLIYQMPVDRGDFVPLGREVERKHSIQRTAPCLTVVGTVSSLVATVERMHHIVDGLAEI